MLVFHVFGALAEFERNLTRERTQAGLQAARSRGRKGGRPKVPNKVKLALAVQLYDERKHTVAQICELMGASRPTLYICMHQKIMLKLLIERLSF
ncbi:recombinase family protein [Salmonella enterica subsp. enterica]|nr:recombinase family protein [Salmonella enterica subsp. enterica]EDT7315907.1 recombinase family protein [Salmonella enterica subsp. enterica]